MAALSREEKERVRYHLGYLNLDQVASLSLGFPSTGEIQFLLDRSFVHLLPEALPGVRRCIQELDCIEDDQSKMRRTLQLSKAGGVEFRGSEAFAELENQYRHWAQKLGDTLGVPVNIYSMQHNYLGTLGGGVIEPT